MPASTSASIGLKGVSAVLPPRRVTIDELASQGRLTSSSQVLGDLGFAAAHVADETHDAGWLVRTAAKRALADAQVRASGDIGLLVFAGGLADSHQVGPIKSVDDCASLMSRFRYPSGRLQDELGLDMAEVLGIAQQGCASMFAAVRVARNALFSQPDLHHVMCVGVDVLPPDAGREIAYNVISDAAAALIVSRDSTGDRWLGYHQICRGYYWDTPARQAEIIAGYFPMARLAIAELLESPSICGPMTLIFVIPSGIQRAQLGCACSTSSRSRDTKPVQTLVNRSGNSICADNFLYLERMRARKDWFKRGAKLLLFTYGFGSSWCCLLLEH